MATRKTNPYGKTVSRDKSHMVWQTPDGSWTWYVRKTYQHPDREAGNPYARWFCDVVTPYVPGGETGDVYVYDIKRHAIQIK